MSRQDVQAVRGSQTENLEEAIRRRINLDNSLKENQKFHRITTFSLGGFENRVREQGSRKEFESKKVLTSH